MTSYVLLSQVMDIIPAEEYESHMADALKLLNDHKKRRALLCASAEASNARLVE